MGYGIWDVYCYQATVAGDGLMHVCVYLFMYIWKMYFKWVWVYVSVVHFRGTETSKSGETDMKFTHKVIQGFQCMYVRVQICVAMCGTEIGKFCLVCMIFDFCFTVVGSLSFFGDFYFLFYFFTKKFLYQ